MSDDEQLQAKKDTLWEIHEQKVKIACLEKKVSDHLERWAKIAKAWEDRRLGTVAGQLARRTNHNSYTRFPAMIDNGEFSGAVRDLEEATEKLKSLDESFTRMTRGA